MAEDITLYWASDCPPCWRVMLALQEKGLQGYNGKRVRLYKYEQKGKDVVDINPRGQVPALKHGDSVVNESIAICLYLESRFPSQGTPLLLAGPGEQALMYQRMLEGLTLQKKISAVVMYAGRVPEAERHDSAVQRNRAALTEELQLWEKYMQQVGEGPFLAGKSFSLADVVVFPVIAYAVRFGLSWERYPRLGQYYSLLKDRPGVKSSWPPDWTGHSQEHGSLEDL